MTTPHDNPSADDFAADQSTGGDLDLALPNTMVDELRALANEKIDVPSEIEASIRSAATAHFDVGGVDDGTIGEPIPFETGQRYFGLRVVGAGVAAAALIAVSMLLWFNIEQGRQPAEDRTGDQAALMQQEPPVPTLPGDIDQSGGVDIVDALKLAKQLEAGDPIPPMRRYDLNRDGAVDGDDVQAIATQVVDLNPTKGPQL